MKTILIFLCCFAISPFISAQPIDELYDAAQESFKKGEIDAAIAYYHKIDTLAKRTSNDTMIMQSAQILGDYYNMSGQFEKAESYFEFALPLAENAMRKSQFYHGYSTSIEQRDSKLSEEYLLKSIEFGEQVPGPKYEMAAVYGDYGTSLRKQGRYKEAVSVLEKALSYAGSPLLEMQLSLSLSDILMNTENYSSAEEYILNAIAICEREGYKLRNGMAGVHYSRLLRYQGKFKQALEELELSIKFFTERKQENYLGAALYNKMTVLIKMNDWEGAQKILEKKR